MGHSLADIELYGFWCNHTAGSHSGVRCGTSRRLWWQRFGWTTSVQLTRSRGRTHLGSGDAGAVGCGWFTERRDVNCIPVLTLTSTEDETTPLSMVDALVASMGEHPNHYAHGRYRTLLLCADFAQLLGETVVGQIIWTWKSSRLTNASSTSLLAHLGLGRASDSSVSSEYLDWD